MRILCFGQESSVDKDQIIDVVGSLLADTTRGILDQELPGTTILVRKRAIEIANTEELIPLKVILERVMLRKGISNAY
jgi:hypothetical protein